MEEDINILKEVIEEYKSCSIKGANMRVDVTFNEIQCSAIENVLKELEKYREYKKGLTKNELIYMCASQEEDIKELNKELETLKKENEKAYLNGFKDSEDKYGTVIADNMKKDKLIDEMVKDIWEGQSIYFPAVHHINDTQQLKQYFIKKVEEQE